MGHKGQYIKRRPDVWKNNSHLLYLERKFDCSYGDEAKKNNGRLKKKLNSAHSQYFFQGQIHTLVLGLVV